MYYVGNSLEQLQQAEAASGNRLILKRANTKLESTLIIIGTLLIIPTLGLSLALVGLYLLIKGLFSHTVFVKNIANGEKFYVTKMDFKAYKKRFRLSEKEIKKI